MALACQSSNRQILDPRIDSGSFWEQLSSRFSPELERLGTGDVLGKVPKVMVQKGINDW